MARKKNKGYRSQQQVKWAFATHQKFARRWAHEAKAKSGKKTWYRKLPKKKISGSRARK